MMCCAGRKSVFGRKKKKKGIRRVWLYFVGHKIYFYEKRLQYHMLVDSFIPFLTFTNKCVVANWRQLQNWRQIVSVWQTIFASSALHISFSCFMISSVQAISTVPFFQIETASGLENDRKLTDDFLHRQHYVCRHYLKVIHRHHYVCRYLVNHP